MFRPTPAFTNHHQSCLTAFTATNHLSALVSQMINPGINSQLSSDLDKRTTFHNCSLFLWEDIFCIVPSSHLNMTNYGWSIIILIVPTIIVITMIIIPKTSQIIILIIPLIIKIIRIIIKIIVIISINAMKADLLRLHLLPAGHSS